MPETLSPELQRSTDLRMAIRDYVYSFWMSSGDPTLQTNLLDCVLAEYDPDYRKLMENNVQDLFETFVSMKMPGSHTGTDIDSNPDRSYDDEFRIEAEIYLEMLANHTGHALDESYDSALAGMIISDLKYQTPDNLRRYRTRDPHKSNVREHILKGISIGSPTYDAVFATMSQRMKEAKVTRYHYEQLEKLAYAWESTHPGEKFFVSASYED